jgi:formylglycine-generating enzyme required for sulfatase activity
LTVGGAGLLGTAVIVGVITSGWVAPPPAKALASQEVPQEVVNSLGMRFRLVPGGSFLMGSSSGQPDERPPHRVTLSPFYMAVHEVAQSVYGTVIGENPSRITGTDLPVESVDWHEATAFCARLSGMDGATYRLPTEAEWEYAARGGHDGREYAWGDSMPPLVDGTPAANVADEAFRSTFPDEAARGGWVPGYDDGFATTAPVGSFPANGLGLHDMIGNVFEWCSDAYDLGTQYYLESPEMDPTGPEEGSDRVLRGASWWAGPGRYYRVASRFRDAPEARAAAIGFRCVLEVRSAHPSAG